ncbi:MAG: glycyl radical protein [Verrucomicrobia bacterium]|nr:glycyl radical protein [Verrucomicrobiota bacterium]
MTSRTEKLRLQSLEAQPCISHERAELITEFYRENEGRYSIPVMRALAFRYICERKTIYIGDDELIVGERGPWPKATPTFPELTCHSLDDLRILNSREKTNYRVSEECFGSYENKIIPYWRGRSMRDRIFEEMSEEWKDAYTAGIFTEFMEQRAPGHTVLDGKIYGKGMLDFKRDIEDAISDIDYLNDDHAYERREALKAFDIACDAVILFAERHAHLAGRLAEKEEDERRKSELERIAEVCTRVPAHAPRTFQEALQYYWFCHLSVITELNGWDAFNPGHLDRHMQPFFEQGIVEGTLTREQARELLECFFIKFNNHPAPPKVGVTAEESGTYTDFANINIGGLLSDGSDGVNELSYLLLDIIDEMHLLQPSSNIQLSRKNSEHFLKHALRVVRKGYGFPSIFNADAVVEEQLRQGKSVEDARDGGCSGCVEVGAFGKEAYILTGYFNMVKILELMLHNGVDPMTGKQVGLRAGAADSFKTFDELFNAWREQFRYFLDVKLRGNRIIQRMYALTMPAPFLSVLIDDCIAKGTDYNAGGARYNNTYVQFVGLGSLTDSFSVLKKLCFDGIGEIADDDGRPMSTGVNPEIPLNQFIGILDRDFEGEEVVRQRLLNKTPKYGNDDDYADRLMLRVFNACFEELDGRPDARNGCYRVEMLPTTCHVYFGSVTGAMPDGRKARFPLSEGISPVQGMDRLGPTGIVKSVAKMDHIKAGGTLLNMKLSPGLVASDDGLDKWAHLIRAYFKMDGHHMQFNVVSADTLREAKEAPERHRHLIVRVAGYSDYFCDLSEELKDEIIARTEQGRF